MIRVRLGSVPQKSMPIKSMPRKNLPLKSVPYSTPDVTSSYLKISTEGMSLFAPVILGNALWTWLQTSYLMSKLQEGETFGEIMQEGLREGLPDWLISRFG